MNIQVFPPTHLRVRSLLEEMYADPQRVAAAALLFGGDRWHYVEHVTLAIEDDRVIGLGSLAPCDEMGHGDPQIIGIYVLPEHRRRGVGLALFQELVAQCQQHYQRAPSVVPATEAGLRLCQRAQARGIAFQLISTATVPIDL